MRKSLITLGLIGVMMSGCNANTVKLDSQEDKENYALGVNMARSFFQQNVEIDVEAFIAGFKDSNENTLKLSNQELEENLINFFKKQEQKALEAQQSAAGKIEKKG